MADVSTTLELSRQFTARPLDRTKSSGQLTEARLEGIIAEKISPDSSISDAPDQGTIWRRKVVENTAEMSQERSRRRPTQFRVSGLSSWTGKVVDVESGIFTSDLTPTEGTPGIPVLADFRITTLSPGDRDIIVGDVVYVTTRTVKNVHGLPTETSAVRKRRLGQTSAEELVRIGELARQLEDSLIGLTD